MIGDTLIFLPIHYQKADYILFKLPMNRKQLVIAIAGESGTGKTEIARILQDKLWKSKKIRSKVISIDDYYKTPFQIRDKMRRKLGIESVGAKEVNLNKLKKIVKRFKEKKKNLYLQRIHRYINSKEYVITKTKNIDILIFEGLYALLVNPDFGIYLEGSIENTYEFRKKRMKENPDNKFRLEILKRESKSVRRTKPKANIIIPFILAKKEEK